MWWRNKKHELLYSVSQYCITHYCIAFHSTTHHSTTHLFTTHHSITNHSTARHPPFHHTSLQHTVLHHTPLKRTPLYHRLQPSTHHKAHKAPLHSTNNTKYNITKRQQMMYYLCLSHLNYCPSTDRHIPLLSCQERLAETYSGMILCFDRDVTVYVMIT